ncbi:J domain-containing protein [Gallaecimonas xiamenensis]|uniref:J domain-containing protein n=1 Tax=Gallaecimonas xiamenensis 3-C-1 TaxID=745411 RepID=K2JGR4_9GAMM|nr:J domain-containing protein [Gallaecimonas xiamenensis]EKE73747.1 hypothetical protein B3C1_10127 [Gallaecimonas xiamenensis 3-C-1]
MTCWEILGIAPTPLKKEIKRAYFALLKKTNPEDDPAGFQVINQAYQDCLAEAKHAQLGAAGDAPAEEPLETQLDNAQQQQRRQLEVSDIDSLDALEQVMLALTFDPAARWELGFWQDLIKAPVFNNLKARDAQLKALEVLAKFRQIPAEVYQLFDQECFVADSELEIQNHLGEELFSSLETVRYLSRVGLSESYLKDSGLEGQQLYNYLSGRNAMVLHSFTEAIDLDWLNDTAQQLGQLYDQDMELTLLVSRINHFSGNTEAALAGFEAVVAAPERVSQAGWLEAVKVVLDAYLEQRRYSAMPPLLGPALEQSGKDPDLLKLYAQYYAGKGYYSQALSFIDQVLDLTAADYQARIFKYNYSHAHFQQLEQSNSQFEDQLELLYELQQYQRLIDLAEQRQLTGNTYYALALNKLERAADCAAAVQAIAEGHTQAGENQVELIKALVLSEAIWDVDPRVVHKHFAPYFQPLADICPGDFELCLVACVLHRYLHYHDEVITPRAKDQYLQTALACGKEGLELNPHHTLLNFNMGLAAFYVEDYPLVISCYGRYLDTNYYAYWPTHRMALAYHALFQLDEAKETFERAFSIAHNDSQREENLAKLQAIALQQGNMKELNALAKRLAALKQGAQA